MNLVAPAKKQVSYEKKKTFPFFPSFVSWSPNNFHSALVFPKRENKDRKKKRCRAVFKATSAQFFFLGRNQKLKKGRFLIAAKNHLRRFSLGIWILTYFSFRRKERASLKKTPPLFYNTVFLFPFRIDSLMSNQCSHETLTHWSTRFEYVFDDSSCRDKLLRRGDESVSLTCVFATKAKICTKDKYSQNYF